MGDWISTHLEHYISPHAHTVIRFDAFESKIYGCTGPVCIAVIHRNQDYVLREDIDLF